MASLLDSVFDMIGFSKSTTGQQHNSNYGDLSPLCNVSSFSIFQSFVFDDSKTVSWFYDIIICDFFVFSFIFVLMYIIGILSRVNVQSTCQDLTKVTLMMSRAMKKGET